MKKIILSFLVFSTIAAPSLSHAQIPFGGYDAFRFPVTCSIPPFIPSCSMFTTPPTVFFDFFIMLNIGGVPIGGSWLAVPMTPLMFPGYALYAGEWALGFESPITLVGGIFIPAIPLPYGGCIPSMCIPIAPAIGIVGPMTGAAPGFF